jgi:zinc transporter ZupT
MEWIAIPLGAVVMGGTMLGGYVGLRFADALPTVLALSGGIVVAVAIFDVLPEAMELLDDPHDVGLLVGVGFLAFFLLERVLVLHHRDDAEQARSHHHVGVAGALGLSVHSFIDGLGIGLAFGVDTETGLLVLRQSGDRAQAVRWLRIDAIAPVLGAAVGSAVSISDTTLGYILALYAGFFLYLGGTDLLPEAHHEHGSWGRVALTLAGFAFVFAIAQIAQV